jgi:peroxiredoxin
MTLRPMAEALEEAFQRCCDMDASLSERLDSFARAVRTLSPPFADAVDRLVTRLRQSGAGETAPQLGEPMPPFHLPNEAGRIVSLDEVLSKGPVAVTFHRGHWCPYCRLNTIALAKAQKEIESEGSQIVAIMPDRQQFAGEFQTELKAQFPILTDMDNGYALALNLVIWVGAEMERMISAAGWKYPGLPRQYLMDASHPGYVCRGEGWKGQGALRRSRLSQTHGDRKHDRSAEKRTLNQFVWRDQSAARSIFKMADATAVRSRPATP